MTDDEDTWEGPDDLDESPLDYLLRTGDTCPGCGAPSIDHDDLDLRAVCPIAVEQDEGGWQDDEVYEECPACGHAWGMHGRAVDGRAVCPRTRKTRP